MAKYNAPDVSVKDVMTWTHDIASPAANAFSPQIPNININGTITNNAHPMIGDFTSAFESPTVCPSVSGDW
ncbi:MAG: hypothetical protein KDA60_23295 [Planctomycetales bacterium]|nr:hypothetical protein [Planctomycetales bacterium]